MMPCCFRPSSSDGPSLACRDDDQRHARFRPSSGLLTWWYGPVASGRATALASTSHAQYDRTTSAPADGQVERVRRCGEAEDPAHGNPDLAIAEPLGHFR